MKIPARANIFTDYDDIVNNSSGLRKLKFSSFSAFESATAEKSFCLSSLWLMLVFVYDIFWLELSESQSIKWFWKAPLDDDVEMRQKKLSRAFIFISDLFAIYFPIKIHGDETLQHTLSISMFRSHIRLLVFSRCCLVTKAESNEKLFPRFRWRIFRLGSVEVDFLLFLFLSFAAPLAVCVAYNSALYYCLRHKIIKSSASCITRFARFVVVKTWKNIIFCWTKKCLWGRFKQVNSTSINRRTNTN